MEEAAAGGASPRRERSDGRVPFRRLLVGDDGGAGGRDALALAALLAADGAETLARNVEDGSPARELAELAEAEAVDLIVVGSPHRGPVGRVLLGSVAESLLHGAGCPVAVAPRGYAAAEEEPRLRTVAVAYDGSPEARIALRRAEGLAASRRAGLRLLLVVRPSQAAGSAGGAAVFVPEYPPDPERVLHEGMDSVEVDVHVEGRRLEGPPAPVLAAACEDADLLLVGSRGHGPALRVLLGSVSTELARSAPCPVLVTPRGG